MLRAAREMGENDLALRIAKQLEIVDANMVRHYPDLM